MKLEKEFKCSCGKTHQMGLDEYICEAGAINKIADYVKKYGCKNPFVVSDINTYKAAGERVCQTLSQNSIKFSSFSFSDKNLEPDEKAVGSLLMHYNPSSDIIIGVGSGVINDLCKVLSYAVDKPYIIVATAPSMDGYASASSSMAMDGLKVTLPSKCANAVIGDIDILKNAPSRMLVSGLGDMLAKYISICEWRIANIITGEYYCETVAEFVRAALKKCIDNADGLLKRNDDAVKAVFEGLVIGGVAMNYAGLSRPASGVEHYFSHVWDMRGLEFGTAVDFHGIQCAIGTLYAARIYDYIRKYTPQKEKACKFAESFDFASYSAALRNYIGPASELMISAEANDKKYDLYTHKGRLEKIIASWDEILNIINDEVPTAEEIKKILDTVNAPKSCEEIGIDKSQLPLTYAATKDIRDKYVQSRLCWDLGIIDEITFEV